jgi:prepilin-type N-terminal cleavage/methylation domain-containing protein
MVNSHDSKRAGLSSGFTLIELLIVIAIILILIAIALPNFLEAQTRTLMVKATSELRTISQALEQYYGDFRFYPMRTTPRGRSWPSGLNNLTTPVQYMHPAKLPDPFPEEPYYVLYRYWPIRPDGFIQDNTAPSNKDSHWYLLSSNGPDHKFDAFAETLRGAGFFRDIVYSPTNGTKSLGNVWRRGGYPDGVAHYFIAPQLPSGFHN